MILQKIKTGSSLYLAKPHDADFLVFYNSNEYSQEHIKALRKKNEDFFLIDVNSENVRDKDAFFVIMTYIIHSELKLSYEIYGGQDFFKSFFNANIGRFNEIVENAKAMYLHPDTNKINWWFKGAENYLKDGTTGLSESFIISSRPEYNPAIRNQQEMAMIEKWFNETDYIELQAVRGTISRDSEKYQNYLTEYNTNLARYKQLKDEL